MVRNQVADPNIVPTKVEPKVYLPILGEKELEINMYSLVWEVGCFST